MSAGTRKRLRRVLAVLLLLLALGFGVLEGMVLAGARDRLRGEPAVMVILGCQAYPWGPSVLLQDRLDTALAYLRDHPGMTVVVSGGQGDDETTTEALCMKNYLVSHGAAEETILTEDQSQNTWQNLQYSLRLLDREGLDSRGEVLVVSNGFHLARTRLLWGRLREAGRLSTLAAPSSHAPSRLRMYLREPLALVKSFLLDR